MRKLDCPLHPLHPTFDSQLRMIEKGQQQAKADAP
jgi:hypothetical protein